MSGTCLSSCEKYPEIFLTPSRYSLNVQRGANFEFDCILTNAYGEPIDITIDTVVLTVKDSLGGTVQILKMNLPLTHIDGAQGRTRFEIEPTDITGPATYLQLSWVFEVRRITPGGDEYVHIAGPFIVYPEV